MIAPLLLLPAALSAQEPAAAPRPATGLHDTVEIAPVLIGSVEIVTADVYREADADEVAFYRLVNALHATTRPRVIENELWFGPGEHVRLEQLEELERNLRATGLFSSVEVTLREPVEPGGPQDVVITTADRLSLLFSASGAVAGGVGSVSAGLGETNLFGRGDQLLLNYSRNDLDEETLGLSFSDRHFLHPRLRLSGSVGETEEGAFWSARLSRDFQHLEDPWAWNLGASQREDAADFFEFGSTVAEVPRRTAELSGAVTHAFGTRDEREKLGVSLSFADSEYDTAVGPGAAAVDVPNDTRTLTAGPFYSVDFVHGRRKVENLDTLDFVQDLEFGWSPDVQIAAVLRDEDGRNTRFEPLLRASVRLARELDPSTFLTARAGGWWRSHDGDTVGRALFGALHAFHFASPNHTLAASLTYDDVLEREGLPRQLTLGEDNGLRGYPARLLVGERRARLNLEDRIDTGLEVASVHVDLVAFADAGWVEGAPSSPDEVLTSAGFGLRLGSSELFGSGVLRIDVAFPLTDTPGSDDDVSLSIAFGQVFTFFGNSSTL